MVFRSAILFVILILMSGCNLGTVPEEELLPTDEPTTIPTGKPQVTIISPRDGAEFEVGEQILVSVNATDSAGVTGIQLVAAGDIVKSVSSPTTGGDREYPAVLDFTPRDTGEVQMQVIAYRGATASDPASVSVTVLEDVPEEDNNSGGNSDSGGTGNTGPVRPSIPNDGVCRALTTVNLNFRSQPTTAVNNVITVLPVFTLVPIIGRLPDNSWWKVRLNLLEGWVSANFTEESGNCTGIPIENPMATPTPTPTVTPTATPSVSPTPTNTPDPGKPDLVIPNISGSRSLTIPADETSVSETYGVSVTNLGPGPAGTFAVTLRRDGTIVQDWIVSDLSAGQSISLSVSLVFDAAGSYDLRVEADPDDEIDEVSNVNNRGDITVDVEVEE